MKSGLILHFITLARICWLSVHRRGSGNFTTARNIIWKHFINKASNKECSYGYSQKICFLKNFAFYNFSENLVFNLYKRIRSMYKLLKIPYGIVTVTKILRKTAVRTFVFCKMSDFTTFLRILTSSPQKRIGQLCSYLKYHMSHCNKKFLKKYCSYGYIQENLYFLKFCILRFLLEFYFSALRRLRSFIPCCNIT